jgi:hypothetical protein
MESVVRLGSDVDKTRRRVGQADAWDGASGGNAVKPLAERCLWKSLIRDEGSPTQLSCETTICLRARRPAPTGLESGIAVVLFLYALCFVFTTRSHVDARVIASTTINAVRPVRDVLPVQD